MSYRGGTWRAWDEIGKKEAWLDVCEWMHEMRDLVRLIVSCLSLRLAGACKILGHAFLYHISYRRRVDTF